MQELLQPCRRCLTCPCFLPTYFPLVLQETALTKATLRMFCNNSPLLLSLVGFQALSEHVFLQQKGQHPSRKEPRLTVPDGRVPGPSQRVLGRVAVTSELLQVNTLIQRAHGLAELPPHPLRCLFCAENTGGVAVLTPLWPEGTGATAGGMLQHPSCSVAPYSSFLQEGRCKAPVPSQLWAGQAGSSPHHAAL